jgi:hypothetical protein
MNAHREIVKPRKGILRIEIPEEMKNAEAIEIFMVVADNQPKIEKKKKVDLTKLAGKYKNLAIKDDLIKQLDELRNEWERPIF